MTPVESNKAKIAKRVIEVLEFFDEDHPQATVMDIVRRFDRPQSSTSELLSSLVDLGLLYKDQGSRSYAPTPRAAMLGTSVQPKLVRDGSLIGLIDRLAAQTGLGVAVFGMVGLKTQIYSWRSGKRTLRAHGGPSLSGGIQEFLTDSAAGWLLLSTISQPRRDGIIRRLNAEAAEDRKFAFADMALKAQQCCDLGHAAGPIGFGVEGNVAAVLIPGMPENQPLAIGFVYDALDQFDSATLLRTLSDATQRCCDEPAGTPATVQPLFETNRSAQLEKMHG